MSSSDEAPAAGPVVLVVCTGNVCRSPAAELLLRAGLPAGVEVGSAGLEALAGQRVAEPMARLLRSRGVDPAGFTARQLQPATVRGAGLILTMTTAQRRRVVGLVPGAVRRTFTLREFAALAELAGVDGVPGGPAGRLAAVLEATPRARALRTGVGHDDIEDPYGRSDKVFAAVLAGIADAVDRLVGVLRPREDDAPAVTEGHGEPWKNANPPIRVVTHGSRR